jgi:putative flippase GtrA
MGLLKNKFIRFLIVGGINTLFGYSVFSLFIFFKVHYTIASLFATIIGVLFNFKSTGKLVFNNTNNRLLIKFILVYTFVYLINISLLRMLNNFDINLFLSGAIILLPISVVSFVLNKKFVFKEKV